ncbi:MAG: pyridoxamine 5'-phosphate oxidase [Acidocella sp. 20-57-95]|nr:MAG: pyridoxamine 5'-phosphate oxidase [Acidocella sp. 20-57-95]OYV59244.1 MAG: pyridoxamine 5'-phosphate oxidase [Acidocella sp. 21-58-7]HQT64366.1 pyridoxamine 5'-phosphate oxidase [Acidocella sp.]HQU03698.1 pyridoxamine 5'-phosphate oxidase [Acidocella sp.]
MDQEHLDPFVTFRDWLTEASNTEPNDPNAMILATASSTGRPAARTVLLKAWDRDGFVFYTNLESRKSQELRENPQAALLFYWKTLHRQVRIEGPISMVSDQQANEYYASRPRISRIGAWASAQSRPLPDRKIFDDKIAELEAKYPDDQIPRPPFWSGWRVRPEYFEFWQDVQFRLHDRTTYRREGNSWVTGKLYP